MGGGGGGGRGGTPRADGGRAGVRGGAPRPAPLFRRQPMADDAAARRAACLREAHIAGATAAAQALAASGLAVGLGLRFAPSLRAALSASSATALVVTPAFGMYFLNSQLALSECARRRRD